MSQAKLAAIPFDRGRGDDVDAVLSGLTRILGPAGLAMAGALQTLQARPDRNACDLVLSDLGTGSNIRITEDRGPLARGCRLDPVALEEAVALSLASIAAGARLLIVNRFGKQEVDGGGFRPAIAEALAREMPCLVAVSTAHLAPWRQFTGDLARELPCELSAIRSWLTSVGL